MRPKLSLAQRFSALLTIFVAVIVAVLYMLVQSDNETIDFGLQELKGNVYQRPLERAMFAIMKHRIVAQRALYGEKRSLEKLPGIAAIADKAFGDLQTVDAELGEDLQFTDQGLASRKREHFRATTVTKEWNDLKAKLTSLTPAESNEQHAHLIADLRTMITHSGDTSNLILDPDLDSYYLMDITLLALPQSQDRIQNVIVQIEPLIRRQRVEPADQIKASVFAAMMTESDLERVKADFQTVLNEDPHFYGRIPTLNTKLAASHDKFVAAYKEFIDFTQGVADGKPGTVEQFVAVSDKALDASFEFWEDSVIELDTLVKARVGTLQLAKQYNALASIIGLMFALIAAWMFVRYLVRNMRSIVTVLNQSSHQVFAASTQSASSATQLSEASTEQAASLQETMASIEEISAMVSQNADSATKTKTAVDANQKVSEEGSRSVDEMLSAISEIRQTNDEILQQMEISNKEFAEIVKIISEIGNKTNVINEIVFQTKLLSFNASVEAARAGEHGKGFAVVAEEVGNLAQMSGNAAREITGMLADSIKKVNEIVENTKSRVDRLVEVGKDKISMGQSTAQKCRDSLNKITENASTVAGMINEITHASREQAQGIQEINKAISQLDQVTQQNSSVAHQSSSQADSLRSEADALKEAVQSLVAFVDGARKSETAWQERAKPDATSSHVVPISRARETSRVASKKPAAHKHSNGTGKVAVGASGVPSGDDPSFEEF